MLPVTVEISTKNRYENLGHCLMAVAIGTQLPSEIIVYDDNERPLDLRTFPIFANIFSLLNKNGVNWKVLHTFNRGQVQNHQAALIDSCHDLIWRIDDDDVPSSDCLERLYKIIQDPQVGAAAGSIVHPNQNFPIDCTSPFIEDCKFKLAVQFSQFSGLKEVQHLYNSFLFNKNKVRSYKYKDLSIVGHREETMFSYDIYKKGYKLIVDGECLTYHMKMPTGGIRDCNQVSYWQKDEAFFDSFLKSHKVYLNKYKTIYLNNGLGDNFAFKHILSEIQDKYSDSKILIFTCYPEVFWDCKNVEVSSLNAAHILLPPAEIDRCNVYKRRGKTLIDAFRSIYV